MTGAASSAGSAASSNAASFHAASSGAMPQMAAMPPPPQMAMAMALPGMTIGGSGGPHHFYAWPPSHAPYHHHQLQQQQPPYYDGGAYEELTRRNIALQTDLQHTNCHLDQTKTALEQTNTVLEQNKTALDQVTTSLEQAQRDLGLTQHEVEKVRRECKEQHVGKQELLTIQEQFRAQVHRYELLNQLHQKQTAQAETERKRCFDGHVAKTMVEKQLKSRDFLSDLTERLSAEKQVWMNDKTRLDADLVKLSQNVVHSHEATAYLRKEHTQLQMLNANLEAVLATKEQELATGRVQADTLVRQIHAQYAHVQELTRQLQEKQQQDQQPPPVDIVQLKADHKFQIDALEVQLSSCKKHQQEHKASAEGLAQLKAVVVQLKADHKVQMDALELQLARLGKEHNHAVSALQKSKDREQTLQMEAKKMQLEHEEQVKTMEKLRAEFSALEKRCTVHLNQPRRTQPSPPPPPAAPAPAPSALGASPIVVSLHSLPPAPPA